MRLVWFVVFELILENYWISCDVATNIKSYYDSETVRSFQNQWENSRKSYENALEIALKENFGRKSMNTIERIRDRTCKLSNGFYVNDNVIHMIFQDMNLEDLPYMKNTRVYFPLANNVLHLQSELSKMIVLTKYSLMRNNSEVLFPTANLDTYNSSPFALQQIQENGLLAILVEDCFLSGFTISLLNGETVILGHDTFKISHCKFTIEISSEGLGSPPIIVPYFSKEQRKLLQNLINKPIRGELMRKLQAAVFSYVNTSIFEDDLVKYRNEQKHIFEETSTLVKDIIRNANKVKVKQNEAAQNLRTLDIFWNETNNGRSIVRSIKLKDVVVNGFDSAYSPHIGGPYKLQKVGIAETLRFGSLKVRGKIFFEFDDFKNEHNFSMDLQDVNINIDMNLEDKSQIFNIDTNVFWSDTVFSITNIKNISERIMAESIISGFSINEIPKILTKNFLKLNKDVERKKMKSEKANDKTREDEFERLSDISEGLELNQTSQTPELILQNNENDLNELEGEENLKDESKLEESDVFPSPSEISKTGKERGVKVSISFLNRISGNESTKIEAERRYPSDKNGNLGKEFGNADDTLIQGYEESRRKYKKRNKKYSRRGKNHQKNSHKTKNGKKKIGKRKKHISINPFENGL